MEKMRKIFDGQIRVKKKDKNIRIRKRTEGVKKRVE